MRRIPPLIIHLAFFTVLILLVSGCEDKKADHYERPEWLEPPIYQQLEKRGDCTHFLSLVDKAGYRDILGKAGFFTVFAPTDEAFERFLAENSYAAVNDIDSLDARKIVTYNIVYNGYKREKLDDFQSILESGWIHDVAYKRKTLNYKWVYEKEVDGVKMLLVDQNSVIKENPGEHFVSDDNNNKNIPYFTDNFLASSFLTAYDYNYFFPDVPFSGFNVVDAQVLEEDILAENGVIHIVDKVITPLPNLDEHMASNPQYSLFLDILEKYLVTYPLAPTDFRRRFEDVTGRMEPVYRRSFPYTHFAPNCENHLGYTTGDRYDAQKDGWTLFVPTNQAVQNFFNTKFLRYYQSLDEMSPTLIADFINAHMFYTSVWPSRFDVTINPFGESARFNPETNVVERQMVSNGIFYGTNKVQESNKFYSLLGEVNLNPKYTLMLLALQTSLLDDLIENPAINSTLFLLSNEVFNTLGISWDGSRNTWELDNPALGTNAGLAVSRLMKLCIVNGKELTNLAGDGIIETYGGEYFRFSNNTLWAAGNAVASVRPLSRNTSPINGVVYELSTALRFTIDEVGKTIGSRGSFKRFYDYLVKSAASVNGYIYNSDNQQITNVRNTENNTILVPNDTAMLAAVEAGLLPPLNPEEPVFTLDQMEKILNFVMYHVITKTEHLVVPDGQEHGQRLTLLQTVDGTERLNVFNEGGQISVVDKRNRAVNVVIASSNVLANRAVIHLTDNYLDYRPVEEDD